MPSALLHEEPTATQTPLEVHETPESEPAQPEAVGIGVRWIDHDDPFQCSTNGIGSTVDGWTDWPTATQSRLEVHDTPDSSVSLECAGRGTGWTDQPEAAADSATAATTTPAPTRSVS